METHEMTFFVSGHLDLTKEEFERHYAPAIEHAHEEGASFVVGDARGCDFMAQRLLFGLESGRPKDSGRVRVFHMLERPRHSFGSGYGSCDPNLPKDAWDGRRGGFTLVGGFTSDEDRDVAMTQASTHDIAWVRPAKDKRNSGTAKNLRRRELKHARDRIALRATWPTYNVVADEILDDGRRFVRVSPPGMGWGRPTRLPPELVTRLEAARAAVHEAQRLADAIAGEVRQEYYAQEADRATE